MAEMEEWKKEERKKIANERKVAERNKSVMQNSRKEREEVEALKLEIAKLKEE
jgi:hypothetical protein